MKASLICLLAILTSANALADWGRPGPGPGPGFGGPGPGPGFGGPGRPGPGPGPGGPGWGGGGGPGWGRPVPPPPPYRPRRFWRANNPSQECGPYQPWGTSMACPNQSPNGGPMGMPCDHLPPGTKCFGASYWNSNFVCTNPNNGQNAYGSLIFNMYVCY